MISGNPDASYNLELIRTFKLICIRYSGSYGDNIMAEKLKDFHRRRLQVLASAGPDLIAFEAIPNKMEAQVGLINPESS